MPYVHAASLAIIPDSVHANGYSDAIRVLERPGRMQEEKVQGDHAASLQTYNQVLAIDGANAMATLTSARNFILLEKAAIARPILESGFQAHPENSQLHYELSGVYAQLGEKVSAAEQTKIVQELRSREARTQ